MKKIVLVLTAVIIALGLSGCVSPSSVDAGEEAVLIYKPYFFGHGGVDNEPIDTGLTWTAWSTEVRRVNLKPFNIDEVFDDLVTSDNNPVDFKIHLAFKAIKGKTPILVERFGISEIVPYDDGTSRVTGGWYGAKVKEPLRNSVRSFTKNKKMFEMTTSSDTTRLLQEKVADKVRTFLKEEKIPVELLKVTVGKVMPPKAVIEATIQTGVQKQNVKTQTERVKAEKARKEAEVASAQADKAYMNTIKMTNSQYLRMKELDNQKLAIEKGADINIIMGNAQPMFNIK